MQLKTILNRCHKFKSFVYSRVYFSEHKGKTCIDVEVQPRKNSQIICSGCGEEAPGYDTQRESRRFEFIPLWGFAVYFLYFMRRVDCHCCGVKVEEVPWAKGKSQLTKTYMQFLADCTAVRRILEEK